MAAGSHTVPSRFVRLLVGALVFGVLVTWALPAGAADPRLEEAQRRGEEAQAELADLEERLYGLQVEREKIDARLAELQEQARAQGAQAAEADQASLERARQLYMQQASDPGMAVLTSDSPQQAAEQARFLSFLSRGSRLQFEAASAGQVTTEVEAERVQYEIDQLTSRVGELDAARAEAERIVAERLEEVAEVRRILAEEEAARRAAEEAARRAQQQQQQQQQQQGSRQGSASAPAPSSGAPAPPAQVNGDIACPVGDPNSFRDTWGAPRSGGRSHKGVDIMADTGTPAYAYESGVITRKNSNSLGGISLYMRGDSGNVYYYTHLSGYVSGIDAGDQVSVGTHIAYVGMTGNAPVPHLHWEVMPGGGASVNPYPYALRACG